MLSCNHSQKAFQLNTYERCDFMEYSLGRKIAELRRKANLTQEALAEKMGVSAQAVSKWENEVSLSLRYHSQNHAYNAHKAS